jgi:hypothetical protein
LKSLLHSLPRLAAALAFTASTTAAMIFGGARNAGSAPAAPFSAAPQAAQAAVFVGVGVRFGSYPRWRWDGYHRSWARAGFFYGRPGFIANFGYAGYGAPVAPPYWAVGYYPHYWYPYYRPVFYGGGFYGRGFYGRGYYGGFRGGYRGGYGGGFHGGGFHGGGGFRGGFHR